MAMNSTLLVITTFRAVTSRFDGFGLLDCMWRSLPDRRAYWHCEPIVRRSTEARYKEGTWDQRIRFDDSVRLFV